MDDLDELEERIERLEELERRVEKLESDDSPPGLSLGYGIGVSLAIVLSWARNGSILWCMLHGLFSWGYVIYYAFTR